METKKWMIIKDTAIFNYENLRTFREETKWISRKQSQFSVAQLRGTKISRRYPGYQRCDDAPLAEEKEAQRTTLRQERSRSEQRGCYWTGQREKEASLCSLGPVYKYATRDNIGPIRIYVAGGA